jgi:transposase
MYFAGLDVHKNYCRAIICTETGEVVKEGRFSSRKDEIEKFFAGYDESMIAFEATSNYEFFYEIIENMNCKPILAHPRKTRAIADVKIKTDKIDANILMHLLRTDLLPTSYVPSKPIRELRRLLRKRIYLGRDRSRLKNRIHNELSRLGLEFSGDIFTKKGREWLISLQNDSINRWLKIMEYIEAEIDELEKIILMESCKYEDVEVLTSIKGIRFYSALIILAEIGDINRFPNEEKLFSYAGLVPATYQSGNKEYHGRITKEGSKYLRWILTEAVRVHVRWDKDSKLTKYYYRMKRRKPENVALIATARKLLQIIYHMLKNKAKFRG